jgi:hypothetical protein
MANERRINELLNNLLLDAVERAEDEERVCDELVEEVKSVVDFESVGMLTRDAGLVIRMNDGSEFQVTIVQSQRPDKEDEDDENEDEEIERRR